MAYHCPDLRPNEAAMSLVVGAWYATRYKPSESCLVRLVSKNDATGMCTFSYDYGRIVCSQSTFRKQYVFWRPNAGGS